MKGILLVDKPPGMTSHDVVDRVRRAAGIRRVGHTGTLDPAATGLLVICLGVGTRLSEFLIGLDKVYEGTMLLGLITDSYDLEGRVVEKRPVPPLTQADVQAAFDRLTGDIMQVPPMVSAVKVGGERLYTKARKGETVERAARPVTVREFILLSCDLPQVGFRVRCTRGTYARTLCYDVGEILGCGATLSSLRRTWVGPHSVENAVPVDALATRADVLAHLAPLEDALDLPEVMVRSNVRGPVARGQVLFPADLMTECPIGHGWMQLKSESGQLLAIALVQAGPGGLRIYPKRVFCGAP